MATRYQKKSYIGRSILPFFMLSVLIYFSFHALNGRYGLFAREQLFLKGALLERHLQTLEAQNDAFEKKVSLLRSEQLDQDLLDEQLRLMLNLLHPNEVVIYRDLIE